MAEKLTRVSYVEPNGRARQDKTGNTESRVDMERYVQPLQRMHAAGLHDWGITEGLAVSATVDSPDVRIAPGVAVDATGRLISLAVGGKARLDDQTTTVVEEAGVVLATAELTGPHLVTAVWAETFDRPTFTTTGAFQNDDTPLLRVRPADDVPGDGTEVVLATVELDDGTVTELTADGRRTTGITVARLGLRSSTVNDDTVFEADRFRLGVDDRDDVQGLRVYSTVGASDALIFSLLHDGRLGLGTAVPAAGLDVADIALGGLRALSAANGFLHLGDGFPSGVRAARLTTGRFLAEGTPAVADTATLMVVDSSPENTWNTAAFAKPAIGPHWSHVHWGTTGDWYIRSAATEGKVILQDHTGFVGVGLGNPTFPLDVNANIGLNGLLAVSNWNDGYLRLNQDGTFGNGVHTPSTLSASRMNVGGAFGWGNPGDGNLAVTGRVGVGTEDFRLGRINAQSDGNEHALFAVGANGWSGLYAIGSPNSAVFWGDVHVVGTIFKSHVQFKIDHPVDPENRYLCHSGVESDEMKNVYDGETTLDADGSAVVELPDWFEALNERFRYQLTPIGAAAPNLHVSSPLSGNAFTIAGGPAGGTVCWQVTGVRHDAYAVAHPLVVEAEKVDAERGLYRTPEAFGEPASRGIGFAELNPRDG
jgi:hypothetical protein